MSGMQRDTDDLVGRVIRQEIDAYGTIRVRADSIQGDVKVGQTVFLHHADGTLPLTVTDVDDLWITAELRPIAISAGHHA